MNVYRPISRHLEILLRSLKVQNLEVDRYLFQLDIFKIMKNFAVIAV